MGSTNNGGKVFLAFMVLFCLAALGGSVSFGCYYFHNKKKRARADSANGKLLDEEEYESPVAETDKDGNPVVVVQRTRSSVVALVKDGVDCLSDRVESAKGGVQKAISKSGKVMEPWSDEQW